MERLFGFVRLIVKNVGLKSLRIVHLPKAVRKPRTDKTKCIDCEIQLDNSNSYPQNGGFYPYCKPCHVVRCLKKQTKFKEDCVKYKGGRCAYCGYNKCYPSLAFHHLDPSNKEFNPSKYSKQKLDDIVKNELDGCVLICANCHAETHSQRSFNRELHKYVRNLSDFITINSVDYKLDWWSIIKIDCVNYLNNKCMKCGYQRNLAALQFHHRDPTKKDFTIASANKMPFEDMKSELDKCDLLCANCHGEHHHSNYLNTINRHYKTLADFIKT